MNSVSLCCDFAERRGGGRIELFGVVFAVLGIDLPRRGDVHAFDRSLSRDPFACRSQCVPLRRSSALGERRPASDQLRPAKDNNRRPKATKSYRAAFLEPRTSLPPRLSCRTRNDKVHTRRSTVGAVREPFRAAPRHRHNSRLGSVRL